MSAKLLGLTNNNGWDYFWVENNNKELVTLDSLRYKYISRKGKLRRKKHYEQDRTYQRGR